MDTNGVLRTAASFDFETQSAPCHRVRASDSKGASLERIFSISVTDVNEAPFELTLLGGSIEENQPAGTMVGTAQAQDPDQNEQLTYQLVLPTAQQTNGSTPPFTLQANGSTLQFPAFDYEELAQFPVRIRATDKQGLSIEKDFSITVTDSGVPEYSNGRTTNRPAA